ncbi:MAG: outer membrane protein assembly factor BamA [Acidobacteria bacterium]|nr:outer membrane protein assembly factor BamA [Acidobacteriota bacterium]
MMRTFTTRALLLAALLVASLSSAWAQAASPAAQGSPVQNPAQVASGPAAPRICGAPVSPPVNLPPAGSGPVIYILAPCFAAQGNVPIVDAQTYLYYIQLRPSQPSQNVWVPFDEKAEQTMLEDFKRLWATNFLFDLSIEVTDYVFSNGVVGKLVTYNMEERERVKIVNYEGTKQIDRTKIDEQLRARGIELRLDSFVDRAVIRRVEGVLREMMAEKGFTNADVKHTITPVAGGPKLVNVTFQIGEGPKLKIRDIEFVGNTAKSDRALAKKMKENKEPSWIPIWNWFSRGSVYKPEQYEMDADLVQAYYRQEGYVRAQIGNPEIVTLDDSGDGKTRYIELRIPVTEGTRYRVADFAIDGNTVVKSEALRPLFDLKMGDWYDEKKVRDGLVKARELYGAGGYMEFTGFPDLKPSDEPEENVPAALAAPPPPGPPTVDVTMRLQEGQQYFVNRITFVGNSTTRDNVIRREMRLVEGAVFNTEALKYSVRRLNQLGYFEQINEQDQNAIKTERTAGREGNVDVTLTLKEQNRNQLTFGAGVSQYEGIFGQLAFQTANFLGRGESLTVSLMAGDRIQNYQLAFTEPFLFDRNITAGFDVYKRALQYIGYYTQKSTGGNLMMGFPVADFSRMFLTYAYEATRMTDINELFVNPFCAFSEQGCSVLTVSDPGSITPELMETIRLNPFLFDSLMVGAGGRRTVSKIIPSFVHNTVDNPIFPNVGQRLTLALDLAMLGGNTQYYKPRIEGVRFWRHTSRTSFGIRGQYEFIAPIRDTKTLPLFEKLWLGGEYSIRGFDIRSVGPTDPNTGLVLGGNKSLLFNAEYLFSIVPQVRLIAFYDAGQVANDDEPFGIDKFRTSTGAEVRFYMPVLNVPFRLIFAANPQRAGVLDNNLRPAKNFTFRFAVGSTF